MVVVQRKFFLSSFGKGMNAKKVNVKDKKIICCFGSHFKSKSGLSEKKDDFDLP